MTLRLKVLLERIALQRKEEFPFPDDLESFLEDFVPNALLKSETLQRAFGITDYEMETLYEEAFSAYAEERYGEAVVTFRWLLFFNTYVVKYWMGFAACQQLLGRYEKALEAYAVAALLDCENPYPHFYAGECCTKLNKLEDAEKAFALALERCGDTPAYADLKEEIENGALLPSTTSTT